MTGVESAPAAAAVLPRSLKSILQSVRREFGIVMLVSCFINVLALTSALYMLQVFDRVLSGQSYETLFYLTLIALLAIGVGALLELSRKRILARAG
jgi:ABC-type protease/lipase transport system fused ATPase/permease subunit